MARMFALRTSRVTLSIQFLVPEEDTTIMALRVQEFFGWLPLDPAAAESVARKRCPFVDSECIKPSHGACSVRQLSATDPVICCPNRMYADNFKILREIAAETFGPGAILVRPEEVKSRLLTVRQLNLFGQFTTTVDQVALAFTSPMNLPKQSVYEAAINAALGR